MTGRVTDDLDALLDEYQAGRITVAEVPLAALRWLWAGVEEARGDLEALRDENVALRSRLAHTMRADMPTAERTEHVLRLLDEAAQGVPHMQHGDDPSAWVDEYLAEVWARFIDALDVPEAVAA